MLISMTVGGLKLTVGVNNGCERMFFTLAVSSEELAVRRPAGGWLTAGDEQAT